MTVHVEITSDTQAVVRVDRGDGTTAQETLTAADRAALQQAILICTRRCAAQSSDTLLVCTTDAATGRQVYLKVTPEGQVTPVTPSEVEEHRTEPGPVTVPTTEVPAQSHPESAPQPEPAAPLRPEPAVHQPSSAEATPVEPTPTVSPTQSVTDQTESVTAPAGPVTPVHTEPVFASEALLDSPGVTVDRSEPAREGWRGKVNAVLGTRLAPRPGSPEALQKQAAMHIKTANLPRFSTITLANTKGGVGKTPLSVALAAQFARYRGAGKVVLTDLAEEAGSLADRVAAPPDPYQDVLSLLGDGDADTNWVSLAVLARHLKRQPGGEDVLAGRRGSDRPLDGTEVKQLTDILSLHREILLADTGNSRLAESWQWAVHNADALVVPVPLRRDAARAATRLLEEVATTNRDVLTRTLVLITEGPGDLPMVETEVVDVFVHLGVPVLRMPFDPLFASGERIALNHLNPNTRAALTVLASRITDLLTGTQR